MKKFYALIVSLFTVQLAISQVNTFPYTQDFESFNTCTSGCSGPCNLTAGWSNQTGDGSEWIVDQAGTTSGLTGPSQDHKPGTSSGNYLYTETSGCNNQTALLESPVFDFSLLSNPTINFWYHMYGATMGDMHFDLDTIGNGTWITDVIPAWTDNNNSWQNQEVNLTNLAAFKSNVKFRIRGETGTSFTSDMAIDDFRIYNDIPDDLAITEIVSPVQGCGLTGIVPIEIEITNLGASDQSNFSLAYQVNEQTPIIEVFSGTLNSDDKVNFVFQNDINLNVNADLSLKTWIIFPQDLNKVNDTMSMGLKEVMPLELVNFSGYTGTNIQNAVPGWYEGQGTNSPNPSNSNWTNSDSLQRLFFGTPTAKINLSGTSNSEWIVSQAITITNSARLFFSAAITSKNGTGNASMGTDDKLRLYVSTDCGNTFTSVLTIDASNGLSSNLAPFSLNLASYIGQDIILAWRATDGPSNDLQDYDLHLTSIEARRVFPNDVGIIDFRTANGDKIIDANNGENIFIRLKNFGSNSISNIPIISKVGNINFQNVYSNTLGSNGEVDILLGAYFGDPNGSASIAVNSYTMYTGDTINLNDTLNAILTINGAITLGINDFENDSRIYPNPFNESISISFSESELSYKLLEISDIHGSVVERIKIEDGNTLKINTLTFPEGIYFLRLIGENGSKSIKCIKR